MKDVLKGVIKEYDRLASIYDRKWNNYLNETRDRVIGHCPLKLGGCGA